MTENEPSTAASSEQYSPRSREADRRLRACADLVKYFSEPYTDITRSFVETILTGLRRKGEPAGGSRAFFERAAEEISAALQRLPARQRIIIEKCDIAGNTTNSVARSLHLSRRHLFRERNEALERLSRMVLLPPETKPMAPTVPATQSSRLDGGFAVVDSLMRLGHWSAARAALLDIASGAQTANVRSDAAVRLVRVSRAMGDLSGAAIHLDRAAALSTDGDAPSSRYEREVAYAYVELESGRTEHAAHVADVAERRLWAHCVGQPQSRAAAVEALVDAMSLRAAVAAGQGRFPEAKEAAENGIAACRLFGLGGSVARRVTVLRAMCDVFCERDVASAEETLVRLFEDALADGYPEDALVIAAHLARHLRLHGRAREAVAFLDLVAPFSTSAGSQEACFDILIEQIHSNIVLNRLADASRYFEALRGLDPERPMLAADMHLARACLALRRGCRHEAAEAARAAEDLYRKLNVTRLVGIALRIQAEALIADGRSRKALRAVDEALGVMGDATDPLALGRVRALRTSILKRAHVTG